MPRQPVSQYVGLYTIQTKCTSAQQLVKPDHMPWQPSHLDVTSLACSRPYGACWCCRSHSSEPAHTITSPQSSVQHDELVGKALWFVPGYVRQPCNISRRMQTRQLRRWMGA